MEPEILEWNFALISRWVFVWSLILIDQHVENRSLNTSDFSRIFFPTNIVFQLPIKSEQTQVDAKNLETRILGLRDILVALVIGILGIALLKYRNNTLQTSFFTLGFTNYLYVFAVSYYFINTIVGCLRWLGYPMNPASSLALIAVSPAERWRTWNTYYYSFLHQHIFFPIFKKSGKNLFLAITVTFFVSAFLHQSSRLFYLVSLNLQYFQSITVQRELLFFFLHGMAVYVSLLLGPRWPDSGKRIAWFGVFITWVMMILIHGIKGL